MPSGCLTSADNAVTAVRPIIGSAAREWSDLAPGAIIHRPSPASHRRSRPSRQRSLTALVSLRQGRRSELARGPLIDAGSGVRRQEKLAPRPGDGVVNPQGSVSFRNPDQADAWVLSVWGVCESQQVALITILENPRRTVVSDRSQSVPDPQSIVHQPESAVARGLQPRSLLVRTRKSGHRHPFSIDEPLQFAEPCVPQRSIGCDEAARRVQHRDLSPQNLGLAVVPSGRGPGAWADGTGARREDRPAWPDHHVGFVPRLLVSCHMKPWFARLGLKRWGEPCRAPVPSLKTPRWALVVPLQEERPLLSCLDPRDVAGSQLSSQSVASCFAAVDKHKAIQGCGAEETPVLSFQTSGRR